MPIFGTTFDQRFGPNWVNYVLQSLLAAASVFVVLVALRQQNLVVAASLAARNTEHPPAAGTALGVLMAGFSWRIVLGVVIGAVVLSLIHKLARPVLLDLVAPPEKDAPSRGVERPARR